MLKKLNCSFHFIPEMRNLETTGSHFAYNSLTNLLLNLVATKLFFWENVPEEKYGFDLGKKIIHKN